MNCFEVLGIEPTEEIKKIKRAYASKVKQCHPEEHPEEFKALHDAYGEALERARAQSAPWECRENPVSPGNPEKPEEPMDRREETPPSHADENAWDEAYQEIAGNAGEKGGLIRVVRRMMEDCRNLYMNEKERQKLYRWKDMFEEPEAGPIFNSSEFVTAWYEFLGSHHTFPLSIWKYFDALDGTVFSGAPFGISRYPYMAYIEQLEAVETLEARWSAGTKAAVPEKKKRHLSPMQSGLLYIAGLGGMVVLGGALGIAVGLLFG